MESRLEEVINLLLDQVTSAEIYVQIGLFFLAIITAFVLTNIFKKYSPVLNKPPETGSLIRLRKNIYAMGDLLFSLLSIITLTIAIDLSENIIQQSWLIKIAISLVIIWFLYTILTRFITRVYIKAFIKWILIPIAVLQVFGLLNDITGYLNSLSIEIGNIRISAYGVTRLFVFGIVIFWIGLLVNSIGKQVIRGQQELEIGTREVFAKLFEVVIFIAIFILLLHLLGINLTALTVFGGALGVGLGFGLQSIASNFISGIIILLDRSITVGDYIQLEDGRTGTIRELNMRSAILETYDGKDIMVPNEQFITTNFVNWTHKNQKQRYPIEFTVAYDTDLDLLFNVVREVVASHPKVLSDDDLPAEERPDAEIASFGESGINILVEFWMEGIDDGENRVGADLLYMIWKALKENNIEIPYPQREVKIINKQS